MTIGIHIVEESEMDTGKTKSDGDMPYPYDGVSSDDEVVLTKILNALHWDSSIELSDISVRVDKGIVVLSGTVKQDYQKAAAEAHVRKLAEVVEINNNIVVQH